MSIPCHLSGLGGYTPPHVLTNKDLEARVDTTDAWIRERTGIGSRHILADDEMPTDMALEAARQALASAGVAAEDLTHIVMATCTPEYLCPSGACIVAQKLGITHPVMAFDLSAACAGFLYALEVARGLAVTTPGAHILTIGVEALTRKINWQDRGTCVLFGDGAGAAVVTAEPLPGEGPRAHLDDVLCLSDGRHWPMLTLGGGTRHVCVSGETTVGDDYFINMSGREVFKFAVRNMTGISRELLGRNGLTLDDIDLLVPHQANLRIIEAVRDRLGASPAKTFVNIETMGNTSAASIPLALSQAWRQGTLKPGMRVLLVTFGGGFTWAASLLRF